MHRTAKLLVCTLVAAAALPAAAQSLCGDCNMDGQISIVDALAGAQFAAGLTVPSPVHFSVCDVDDDGDIDIVDALRMAQAAAGLPVVLTCPPPPAPVPPDPGDLLVTEVMQNPAAVLDAVGEWFEVQNISGLNLDLEGCTLADAGTDLHPIASGGPLVVPPGGRLVFGIEADPMQNGNVQLDYQYATFFLANGADEIIVLNPSMVEVVRIEWDGGTVWPDPNGASMNLDPLITTPAGAMDGASWCEATQPWSGADLGSPGVINESCGGGGLPPAVVWSGPVGTCEQAQVTLTFDLTDPDSAALDASVEFSTDGGLSFGLCTPAPASPAPFAVNPVTGVPPAVAYQMVWDSAVDAPGYAGLATIRVSVDDGASLTTGETIFFLENTFGGTAPSCVITSPALGAMLPPSNIDIVFDATDPDGTDLFATFRWSTDGGVSFSNACPAPTSPPPYDVNPTFGQTGAMQVFTWSPTCDGVTSGSVLFRIELDDCVAVRSCDQRFDISGVAAPPPAPGEIVFNEILADPNGDANMDGVFDVLDDEFVELVNITAGPIDLSGIELRDGIGVRHTFQAGTILSSGAAIVVFGGGMPPATMSGNPVVVASTGTLGLNNGGDTVTLQDAIATVIDTYAYGAEGGMNESLVKNPEASTAPMSPGGVPMVLHSTHPTAGGRVYSPGSKVDGTPTW